LKLRQDRQTAADAIAAAVKGLDTALSALDAIAKNPYAKTAILAATQGSSQGDTAEASAKTSTA
jgi:hypothetical protein